MQLKPIRILSIDGGGIRGLIPAVVLAALESRAGKPICRLFDLIAGTSTGGILALALVTPGPNGEPAYSAQQLIEFYERDGANIFYCPAWQRLPVISLLYSLFASRYSAKHIDAVLHRYFGTSRLRDAVTPLLIMSYELRKRDPDRTRNSKLGTRNGRSPHLFRVPPSALRVAYDFIVVSLGTGQTSRPIHYCSARHWGIAGWARPILDVVFDGVSDTVDYQMQQLLPPVLRSPSPEGRGGQGVRTGTERGSGGEGGARRHFRFQAPLAPDQGAMDDTSPEHLEKLKAIGQGIARDHEKDLDELARVLIRH